VSGALASRFIVLTLTKSFYGREDHTLKGALLAELPGILNWSIRGLRQLVQRGSFVQPKASRETIRTLEDSGSPMGAFVRECCRVGDDQRVRTEELWRKWNWWCTTRHVKWSGSKESFGRELMTVVPAVEKRTLRYSGKRSKTYIGIGVTGVTR
jgi:putative DNA primase/helicase